MSTGACTITTDLGGIYRHHLHDDYDYQVTLDRHHQPPASTGWNCAGCATAGTWHLDATLDQPGQ